MHIIKISSVSFKIILTKEDFSRHGINNISESDSLSGDFFAEIIDKTNALYGSPFTHGAIDVEFFESKDGGGELFISRAVPTRSNITYLFTTDNCEHLFLLCKRLSDMNFTNDSRLYYDKGKYSLVLFTKDRNKMLLPILSEYGNASSIPPFRLWQFEEHSHIIIQSGATEKISAFFP